MDKDKLAGISGLPGLMVPVMPNLNPYQWATTVAFNLLIQTKSYPPETVGEAGFLAKELAAITTDLLKPIEDDDIQLDEGPS